MNRNRLPRSSFWEYIPGTGPYKDYAARAAAYAGAVSLTYEERARQRPRGPGLLDVDVNWALYRNRGGKEAFLARQQLCGGSPDFWDTQMRLLQQYLELPSTREVPLMSQIHSGATPELSRFLQQRRFPNAFFTPEMIQEAVAGDPDIVIDRGEADGVSVWNFMMQNEEGDTERLTLVRAGENPAVRTAPYFAVTYVAEYDQANQDVQFVPRPIMERHDGINGALPYGNNALTSRIISALGLETQAVRQPLSFSIDDRPYRFLTESTNPQTSTDQQLGGFVMGQIEQPGRVVIGLA